MVLPSCAGTDSVKDHIMNSSNVNVHVFAFTEPPALVMRLDAISLSSLQVPLSSSLLSDSLSPLLPSKSTYTGSCWTPCHSPLPPPSSAPLWPAFLPELEWEWSTLSVSVTNTLPRWVVSLSGLFEWVDLHTCTCTCTNCSTRTYMYIVYMFVYVALSGPRKSLVRCVCTVHVHMCIYIMQHSILDTTG